MYTPPRLTPSCSALEFSPEKCLRVCTNLVSSFLGPLSSSDRAFPNNDFHRQGRIAVIARGGGRCNYVWALAKPKLMSFKAWIFLCGLRNCLASCVRCLRGKQKPRKSIDCNANHWNRDLNQRSGAVRQT